VGFTTILSLVLPNLTAASGGVLNPTANKIKQKDSLHIACALEAKCKYFITTDKKILNKTVDNIIIINPIDFVGMAGDER
jgi:predicted nucleic acid-binding protein